jgi:hypothetical protein
MPNIFTTHLHDTPREALNWRLALAVLCFGLMGAARGMQQDHNVKLRDTSWLMLGYCDRP